MSSDAAILVIGSLQEYQSAILNCIDGSAKLVFAEDLTDAFSHSLQETFHVILIEAELLKQGGEHLTIEFKALQPSASLLVINLSDTPFDESSLVDCDGQFQLSMGMEWGANLVKQAISLSRYADRRSYSERIPELDQLAIFTIRQSKPPQQSDEKIKFSGMNIVYFDKLAELAQAVEEHATGEIVVLLDLDSAQHGKLYAVHWGQYLSDRVPVIAHSEYPRSMIASFAIRSGFQDVLETGDRLHADLRLTARWAIERERANQRLRFLAERDSLTRLNNRHRLAEQAERIISRAKRRNEIVGVLYIDLDKFKPINDRYGHAAGDRVLQIVAERLREVVRPYDIPARLGGDEFAILLDGLNSREDAERVCERIQEKLSMPIKIGKLTATIGASLGLALFPEEGNDFESLLGRADRRMYRHKRSSEIDSEDRHTEINSVIPERESIGSFFSPQHAVVNDR